MHYRSINEKLGKKTPKRKTPAAKRKTPAAKRKTPAAKTKSSNKYNYRYELHQHVLCPFPPHAGKYKGEIYARFKGTYNVYFFMDNTVRKSVPEKELQTAPAGAIWAKRRRKEYIGTTFSDEKTGTWDVVGLGTQRNVNKYECRHAQNGKKRYFHVSLVVANAKA